MKDGNATVGIINPLDLKPSFAVSVLEQLSNFNIIMKDRKEKILRPI